MNEKSTLFMCFVLLFVAAVVFVSFSGQDSDAASDRFEEDGIEYRVLSEPSGSTPGTVEVVFSDNTYRLDIPSKVREYTVIGIGSFDGSMTIVHITIPETISHISDYFTNGLPELRDITVDSRNENFLSDAYGVVYSKDMKELICMPNRGITDYVIPEGVERCQDMFTWGTELETITIPESLTAYSIGDLCNSPVLKKIIVKEGNLKYCTDDAGVLFNKDKTKLMRCPSAFEGEYSVPKSVVSLQSSSFNDCRFLTKISLPDSLESMGGHCFSGCSSLVSVGMPPGVKSMGDGVFRNCINLTSVDISGGINHIPTETFSGCSNLKSLYLSEKIESVAVDAFKGCTSLTSFNVDQRNEKISTDDKGVLFEKEGGERYGCILFCPKNYTGVYHVPESVTSISDYAFSECTGLTGVELPDGLQHIYYKAFNVCSGLTGVELPDGLQRIGDMAFYGCSNLKTINIPGLVDVGYQAFGWCKSLESFNVDPSNLDYSSDPQGLLYNKDKTTVYCCPGGFKGKCELPSTVTGIYDSCFLGVSGVTEIYVPENVGQIGLSAFNSCTNLQEITMPSVETYAPFLGCTSLSKITITGPENALTVDSIGVLYSTLASAWGEDMKVLEIVPSGLKGVFDVPDDVDVIMPGAFLGCNGDLTLHLGKKCYNILDLYFPELDYDMYVHADQDFDFYTTMYNKMKVAGITVDPDNPYFASDDSGVLFNKDLTELIFVPEGLSGEYTIPSSVRYIIPGAFNNCVNLTSVSIPSSVRDIGTYAFAGCSSLKSIVVDESNQFYRSDSVGVLFSKDGTKLLACPGGMNGDYTVPDGVRYIENYAFCGCPGLNSVTIPFEVTTTQNNIFGSKVYNSDASAQVSPNDGYSYIQSTEKDCFLLDSVLVKFIIDGEEYIQKVKYGTMIKDIEPVREGDMMSSGCYYDEGCKIEHRGDFKVTEPGFVIYSQWVEGDSPLEVDNIIFIIAGVVVALVLTAAVIIIKRR